MKFCLGICIVVLHLASLDCRSVTRPKKEDKKYANLILPILEADQNSVSSNEYDQNVIEVIPLEGKNKKGSKWKDLKRVVELKPVKNNKKMKDAPLAIIVAASDFNDLKNNKNKKKNLGVKTLSKKQKVRLGKNQYEFRLDSSMEYSNSDDSDSDYSDTKEAGKKPGDVNSSEESESIEPDIDIPKEQGHKEVYEKSGDSSTSYENSEPKTDDNSDESAQSKEVSKESSSSVSSFESSQSPEVHEKNVNDESLSVSESTDTTEDSWNESEKRDSDDSEPDSTHDLVTQTDSDISKDVSEDVNLKALDEPWLSYETYSGLNDYTDHVSPILEEHWDSHETKGNEVSEESSQSNSKAASSLSSASISDEENAGSKQDNNENVSIVNGNNTVEHFETLNESDSDSSESIEVITKKYGKKYKILDVHGVNSKQTLECLEKIKDGDKSSYKSYNLSFLFNK